MHHRPPLQPPSTPKQPFKPNNIIIINRDHHFNHYAHQYHPISNSQLHGPFAIQLPLHPDPQVLPPQRLHLLPPQLQLQLEHQSPPKLIHLTLPNPPQEPPPHAPPPPHLPPRLRPPPPPQEEPPHPSQWPVYAATPNDGCTSTSGCATRQCGTRRKWSRTGI